MNRTIASFEASLSSCRIWKLIRYYEPKQVQRSANIPPAFCKCSLPNKSSVLQISQKCSTSILRVFFRILQRVNNILREFFFHQKLRAFFYYSRHVYLWLSSTNLMAGEKENFCYVMSCDYQHLPKTLSRAFGKSCTV